MKIPTETQHRALAFIEACEKSGYGPAKWEAEIWLEDPRPAESVSDPAFSWSHGASRLSEDNESELEHLEHLGWISSLDSASLPRPIEIRASADTAIHDRLIVGEHGEVWSLGASLNSIGSVNTMIIPVPEVGATALRAQAEELWGKAEPVGISQGSHSPSDSEEQAD
jgi:hypothetical protein